ncbi:hypothetical protein C5167_003560 [Papaver somniferum]|uniref:Uncharacterized protein n=1 Tax=Papaver somniferum TaxID=3469 RepID=A0A4Y7L406_PAPSO|nr:hypothetical protein C5167_003560 [Papaver somniferum]
MVMMTIEMIVVLVLVAFVMVATKMKMVVATEMKMEAMDERTETREMAGFNQGINFGTDTTSLEFSFYNQ